MSPAADSEPQPEKLWDRFRERLREPASQSEMNRTISEIADIYESLSPARREYIAAQMLAELATIEDRSHFSRLQLSILALVYPYLSKSDDHRLAAKVKISALFEIPNWPDYTDCELDALAIAAPLVGVDLEAATWFQYIRRRKQDGFGIAVVQAARKNLSVIPSIASEFGLSDNLETALLASYPFLVRTYSEVDVLRVFCQTMESANAGGTKLREFLGAIVDTNAIAPGSIADLLARNQTTRRDIVIAARRDIVIPVAIETYRSHVKDYVSKQVGIVQPQVAEHLGAELVNIYDLSPETEEFRQEFYSVANVANTKLNGEAGLFVGRYLLAASAAAQQKAIDFVKSTVGDRSVKQTLLGQIGDHHRLDLLADHLCQSARDCNYRDIDVYCSIYLEDQSFKALIEPLIETDDINLNFSLRRWTASGKSADGPDVWIGCQLSEEIKPNLLHRCLYDFRGYHVFAVPDWLNRIKNDNLPGKVKDYLETLISLDFETADADAKHPEYGIAARAWLALYGGIEFAGGSELDLPIPPLKQVAKLAGALPPGRRRAIADSDAVVEGLLSGSLDAVLLGAIHGDLVKSWWNTRRLPSSLRRVMLIGPTDFAKITNGRRFFNYAHFGHESLGSQFASPPYSEYEASWVGLLRAAGNILSELSSQVNLPPGSDPSLNADARDFLSNFLFAHLGPKTKDSLAVGSKPRARWAFVPDKDSISRLVTYDQFVTV